MSETTPHIPEAMQVWKQVVPLDDQWHRITTGKIVHVDTQGHEVVVWFENDEMEPRDLRVFGTGHDVPKYVDHVGTAIDRSLGLVWHVYETGGSR